MKRPDFGHNKSSEIPTSNRQDFGRSDFRCSVFRPWLYLVGLINTLWDTPELGLPERWHLRWYRPRSMPCSRSSGRSSPSEKPRPKACWCFVVRQPAGSHHRQACQGKCRRAQLLPWHIQPATKHAKYDFEHSTVLCKQNTSIKHWRLIRKWFVHPK